MCKMQRDNDGIAVHQLDGGCAPPSKDKVAERVPKPRERHARHLTSAILYLQCVCVAHRFGVGSALCSMDSDGERLNGFCCATLKNPRYTAQ